VVAAVNAGVAQDTLLANVVVSVPASTLHAPDDVKVPLDCEMEPLVAVRLNDGPAVTSLPSATEEPVRLTVLPVNAAPTVSAPPAPMARVPGEPVADTGPLITKAPALFRLKLLALKLPRLKNELPEFVSATLFAELPLNLFAENAALCEMATFVLVVVSERLPLTWIVDPRLKVSALIVRLVNGVAPPMAPEKVVAPEVLVVSPKPPSTVDPNPIEPPAESLTVASQVSVTALLNDRSTPVLELVPHRIMAADAGAAAERQGNKSR